VAATAQGGVLSGEDVFQLWDTFGFPADLTELMAQEHRLKVDKEGVDRVVLHDSCLYLNFR
jgi:alanyl-tRNA synthetase